MQANLGGIGSASSGRRSPNKRQFYRKLPITQKSQHITEYYKMKKALLIALIAMTFVGSGCNTASAAGGRYGRPSVSQRGQMGPIARLIELERRKNAALRRMFFGS